MGLKEVLCGFYIWYILAYAVLAGSIYCVFFGVTYNASKIGLESLQANVILLSVVEAVCYAMSIF